MRVRISLVVGEYSKATLAIQGWALSWDVDLGNLRPERGGEHASHHGENRQPDDGDANTLLRGTYCLHSFSFIFLLPDNSIAQKTLSVNVVQDVLLLPLASLLELLHLPFDEVVNALPHLRNVASNFGVRRCLHRAFGHCSANCTHNILL